VSAAHVETLRRERDRLGTWIATTQEAGGTGVNDQPLHDALVWAVRQLEDQVQPLRAVDVPATPYVSPHDGPSLAETSPGLIAALRHLFDEYGQAGVQRTAAQLGDFLAKHPDPEWVAGGRWSLEWVPGTQIKATRLEATPERVAPWGGVTVERDLPTGDNRAPGDPGTVGWSRPESAGPMYDALTPVYPHPWSPTVPTVPGSITDPHPTLPAVPVGVQRLGGGRVHLHGTPRSSDYPANDRGDFRWTRVTLGAVEEGGE
jgi:hypothetical protein